MQIITPRLLLREFKLSDVPAIHSIAKSKGFVFYSLDQTEETARQFVERAMNLAEKGVLRTCFKLAVEARNAPGQCIGYASFDDIDGVESGTPDIGYLIDPQHQGKGYATEAMQGLMTGVLKAHSKIDDIWLTVHPENKASQHVAAKLSFKQVGKKTITTNKGVEPRLVCKTNRASFVATLEKPKVFA